MNDLQHATVGEAMHRGVITCPHGASLRTVARMMAAYDVHCVVVFDEREEADGQPFWGVVSDLDLAAGLSEDDLEERSAGQIAASPVITVPSDETLARAAQLMTENGSAHIVVVEPGTGKPVGVLSTLDLARVAADWEGAGAGTTERSVT
jgi:signal-transduction protein with cAMP-binding, CBS, and nucleotidyltransferase domain